MHRFLRGFRAELAVTAIAAMAWPTSANDWGGARVFNSISYPLDAVSCIGPGYSYIEGPCPAGYWPWGGSASSPYTYPTSLPGSITGPLSSVSIEVAGFFPDPTAPSGYQAIEFRVPISEFARASTVSDFSARMTSAEAQLTAIQDGVSELAAYVPIAIGDLQQEARAGAAMAASLETVAPAAGSKNRLGFNSATYNGETAVSMSYVRQEGRVDISAGVAISGDETLVKGGVGFSW